MQPVAPTTPLTIPTFTGQDAAESVVDFIDDLSTFKTVCGLSEIDVLQRVLLAALRGAAAQWLRFQPPFRSWDTFVAALQAEFLPVDYEYLIRRARRPDTTYRRGPQYIYSGNAGPVSPR
ncbi:hypothetical protein MTO96_030744 [Rhipicephalus appendiculatus]